MSTHTLKKSDLILFTGSECWYRHSLVRDVLFTDGAKHVADAGGAYWLLDEIAFAQKRLKAVRALEFQLWKLTVKPDQTATLVCEDGNGHAAYKMLLPYTDFPLDTVSFYYVNKTILLPSEY